MVEYCLISLYNVLYKLISKVLANRIRIFLLMLISESQSTFVPRIQITNNILIFYEIIYFLKKKCMGNQGFMSLKLDMSKAYDRMEWNYLEYTLFVLGFPHRMINLVMQCLKIVSFSILINRIPKDPIKPSRVLRQDDPLFPYLFLLCTEGLVSLSSNKQHKQRVWQE